MRQAWFAVLRVLGSRSPSSKYMTSTSVHTFEIYMGPVPAACSAVIGVGGVSTEKSQ